MHILNDIMKESVDKKIAWLQHILLVSSSILGIILSLHSATQQCLHIRLVFAVAVVLLLCGVLLTGYVLYIFSNLAEKTRESFHKAIDTALKNDKEVEAVFVPKKKSTPIFEKISYVCLISSLFLFVLYSISDIVFLK